MGLLSDQGVKWVMENDDFAISPWKEERLQPASIDMTLGSRISVDTGSGVLFLERPDSYQPRVMSLKDMNLNLQPGAFILGHTVESVRLNANLAGRIEGKSTLGRLGLIVHSTAGWVDPGFAGQLTLEISNISNRPIALRPGMLIAQLCLFTLDSPSEKPYGVGRSHYWGNTGPAGPSKEAMSNIVKLED